MKPYPQTLTPYYHYDKQSDTEYYGYSKDSVNSMLDDISDELIRIETLVMREDIGKVIDALSDLRERL